MKRQEIELWEGLTDYRPPVFEEYEFEFSFGTTKHDDPKTKLSQDIAALNYSREIVGDPSNAKWVERRKLVDAFKMGIEYAERYLINPPYPQI